MAEEKALKMSWTAPRPPFSRSRNAGSAIPYFPLKEVIKKNIETIERYQEYRESVTGVPSGYKDLDKLTAGFQKSDLIIIAARPSMGKTALGLCIARNAAKESGVPVGFFSLEMSKEQLAMRLLCAEARVDSHKIRSGFLSRQECGKLLQAAGLFMDVPIYIDDTPSISPLELRAKATQNDGRPGARACCGRLPAAYERAG